MVRIGNYGGRFQAIVALCHYKKENEEGTTTPERRKTNGKSNRLGEKDSAKVVVLS